MDGGFSKPLCAGKENQWAETVSVSVRLDNCPFQKKVVQCSQVVNLPLSDWLINPLGNGVVSVAQCWSHCWSICHSATAAARSALAGESPCVQPMHNLHLCHHGHLIHGPIGKRQGWPEREAHCLQSGHPICLIIERLCWCHLLMSICMGHKYLHIFCPFGEISRCLSHQFFQSCSLQVPDHSANPLASAYESVNNHTPFISPSKKNPWPCILTKVLLTVKISLHWCQS